MIFIRAFCSAKVIGLFTFFLSNYNVYMFVIPESTTISSLASLMPYPSLIRVVKTIFIELIVARMVEISTLKFCRS